MQQLWRGLVVLFVLGCWWQLLASKRAFSSGYSAHNVASTRSTHQQLRLPTTLHASWTLGRCAARVESTDHLEVSKALKEVSGILKAPGVTPDAVVRIGLALKEQDARSALLTPAFDMISCIRLGPHSRQTSSLMSE